MLENDDMGWLSAASWQGISGVATILTLLLGFVQYSIGNKLQKNHADSVCIRFVFLFKAHGIERTKIPRFLGEKCGLTVADISTDEKLLRVLNDHILKIVCERFGVRRGWLEGDNGRIYEPQFNYKDIAQFSDFIKAMKEGHPDEFCILEAYKPTNTSPDLFKSLPDISLVFAEPIAEIDQHTIYRYYPFHGPLPWDEPSTRFNLYTFFTLAFTTHRIVLKGYEAPFKFITQIAEGKIIPTTVRSKWIWHPDDYAFSAISHDMPMNSRETSTFWDYITTNGWLEHFDKDIITRPQRVTQEYRDLGRGGPRQGRS